MSQFYEYNWPTTSETDIALNQLVIAEQKLILNGKYANLINSQANLIEAGIIPQITLTSGNDFSAVSFIITGYQNGVFIQESLTGPNANTVTSTAYFDIIESIIPSSGVIPQGATVSAGIGSIGFFPAILLNTEKKIANPAGALRFITAENNPATYEIYTSLNNISNSQPYNILIENHILQSVNGGGDKISQTFESNYVAKNLVIQISMNNSNTPLKMQFLQL